MNLTVVVNCLSSEGDFKSFLRSTGSAIFVGNLGHMLELPMNALELIDYPPNGSFRSISVILSLDFFRSLKCEARAYLISSLSPIPPNNGFAEPGPGLSLARMLASCGNTFAFCGRSFWKV